MPDKYGFETEEDRREHARQIALKEAKVLNERTRIFWEIDATIEDILSHYLVAINLDESFAVLRYPAETTWVVGSPRRKLAEQALRVTVELGSESHQPLLVLLTTEETMKGSKNAERLRDVLAEHTGFRVIEL